MDLQTILTSILGFINKSVIPLLLAIAFFAFIWNVVRYFIVGGASEESQEKARSLALWGITAFVIILCIWGIVNLFMGIFGLNSPSSILPITPDYQRTKSNTPISAPPTNGFPGMLPQEW